MPRNRSACRSSTDRRRVRLVPVAAGPQVRVLGERLGQPVGQRLHHDRLVVVVLRLVPPGELLGAVDGDREPAEVIRVGGQVVGQAPVRAALRLDGLLPQHRQPQLAAGPGPSTTMSSPSACAGQNPYPPRAVSCSLGDDLVQQRVRVVEQLAGLGELVQDRRVLALQLPGEEEELPVDQLAQFGQRGSDRAHAGESRVRQVRRNPAVPGSRGPLPGTAAAGCGGIRAARAAAAARRGSPRPGQRLAPGRGGCCTTPATREASSTCSVEPS